MRERYCFEQHTLYETTVRTHSYSYEDDELMDDYEENVEEKLIGYWAVYDRTIGYNSPIAYTKDANDAQKIVHALNQTIPVNI